MGMDYRYAGSASYSRFNEEWCKLGSYLGAQPLDKPLKTTTHAYEDTVIRFTFPVNNPKGITIPKLVQLWLNHPYRHFTYIQTKKIYKFIVKMLHDKVIPRSFINKDGWQIMTELHDLIQCKTGWWIT